MKMFCRHVCSCLENPCVRTTNNKKQRRPPKYGAFQIFLLNLEVRGNLEFSNIWQYVAICIDYQYPLMVMLAFFILYCCIVQDPCWHYMKYHWFIDIAIASFKSSSSESAWESSRSSSCVRDISPTFLKMSSAPSSI